MQDWLNDPKLNHYQPLFLLDDTVGQALVARDLQTPKAVVVRRVETADEAQRRVTEAHVNQARRLLAFNHRHLVKVNDAWSTGAHAVLVTDYLEGGSLSRLRAYGREHWGQLSAAVALSVLLDAAEGVAAMRRYDRERPSHPLLARDLFIAIDGRGLLMPVLELDETERQQLAAVLPLQATAEAQDVFYFAAVCWEVLFECDVATHRRIHQGAMPQVPDQLPKSVIHLLDQVLSDPEALGGFAQFIEALAEASGCVGPTEARREVSVWAHAAFYEALQQAAEQLGPMYVQRVTNAPETIAVSQATMGAEALASAALQPLRRPTLDSKQPVPFKSTIRARSEAPEAAATVYCPKHLSKTRRCSELSARAPAKPKTANLKPELSRSSAQSKPVQAKPVQSMPAQAKPVQSMPVQSIGPTRRAPTSAQPTARPAIELDSQSLPLATCEPTEDAAPGRPPTPPASETPRRAAPSRPALRKPLTDGSLPPDSSLAAALVQLVEGGEEQWQTQTGVRSRPAPAERKVAGD